MSEHSRIRSGAVWLGAGIGIGIAAYAASVAATWYRYGRVNNRSARNVPRSLLDEFIPDYEVIERHATRVAAPAGIAFQAACDMDFQQSTIVRAIFRTRAFVLGSETETKSPSLGLLDQAKAWGWGILAEVPGQEIVFGGVTQPWLPNPVFQALPAEHFREFDEPGYVKIAWTMRADPAGETKSIISTETRVVTTDSFAREKFRNYWSFVMPGSVLIRRLGLRLVKTEAQRRMHYAARLE